MKKIKSSKLIALRNFMQSPEEKAHLDGLVEKYSEAGLEQLVFSDSATRPPLSVQAAQNILNRLRASESRSAKEDTYDNRGTSTERNIDLILNGDFVNGGGTIGRRFTR